MRTSDEIVDQRRPRPVAGIRPASPNVNTVHLVANRLPAVWADDSGWKQAPGGVAAALRSLDRGQISNWIGSADSVGSAPVDFDSETPYGVCPVRLPAWVWSGAVAGMSNRVLWPALHGIDEHVHYRHDHWDAYVEFNAAFSESTTEMCAPGDLVWVHDYHLLLVPPMVKFRRPDVRVGLSLHTTFDVAGMSSLPDATALAAALSGCDLIGVQTVADVDQLCAFLAAHGQREPDTIRVSPVSVDARLLLAETVDSTFANRLRARAGPRRLVVGIDRLDYTKGILERLVAYDEAFRRRVVDPDEVHIIQVVQPSRTDITEYQALGVELERIAYQLDVDWRRSDGTSPIEFYLEPLERADVLAVLASADIAMVTPRRDGMSVVAKEFSILTEHAAGVLVLSDRSGAAAALGADSVLVDGADPHSVADGLATALRLDDRERRHMATRRSQQVRSWTSHDWASDFINRLADTEPRDR